MWKLLSIHAENLCAFKEFHYVLMQGVTTLIFGNNMDNDSQKSNGSGKSALVEAVALGITGSPLRKIKNEEIINDMADECIVCLQFQNDITDEELFIERHITRKDSATVECKLIRSRIAVPTDEIKQSTIDAYNKYILNKLGITKDELYNNFLLSRHKYQDFLSSSDKEKKEIINRFSNAILVDKAIEKVIEDKLPVESHFREAELDLASIDGRIDMLTEQIEKEENSFEEKKQNKADRTRDLQVSIHNKRSSIRNNQEDIEKIKQAISLLEQADKKVQELENSELPMEECLSRLKASLALHIEKGLTAWEDVIAQKKEEIRQQEISLLKWDAAIIEAKQNVSKLQADYAELNRGYQDFSSIYPSQLQQYDLQLDKLRVTLEQLNSKSEQLKKERRFLLTAIEDIKGKLAGAITCPACAHEFVLSDATFQVTSARDELETKETICKNMSHDIVKCNQSIEEMEQSEKNLQTDRHLLVSKHSEWSNQVEMSQSYVNHAIQKVENQQSNRTSVLEAINFIQRDIENVKRKIFDEAFERIDDSYHSKEKRIQSLEDDIQASRSAIEVLEGMLKDLENTSESEILQSLRKSLKEHRIRSSQSLNAKSGYEKQLKRLEEQCQYFLQFKSFLANTKIEALGKVTNEFLENIESDIRVKFSGYTLLKSGKVREKISVSLLRNGIDCGSFDKFSEGEKARVNLANILAMNKLVNSNAEDGKGIDLLILDEILSAVDENGLACIFLALNHVGITSLVISHGNIAENYPHRLIINKHNGESYLHED